jgi:glycosyltransferase involved in cell wall biosynthesis
MCSAKTIELAWPKPYPQLLFPRFARFGCIMRVVHVFKDCYPPTTGGIEQHMHLLCRKLAQTIDVTILAPSRSRRRIDERSEGVRIIRIPEFGRFASTPLCPTAPMELHSLRPDIIHLHFPNPMGDMAQLLGAFNIPFVLTYHADIIKQKLFLPVYRPVRNLLFKKARKLIFSACENIIEPVIDGYRDKSVVIPFGIEIEAFEPGDQEKAEAAEVRRELDGGIVLFVGAARYYKGLDVLLRAMARVTGHLMVAGRGTQDQSLKQMASDLGIRDRIGFCGEVSASRLRVLLNAADVFVLPSIDRCETFGIGQLEAMACSKPVVSTDLPTGIRSVNRHGITGLVVPPGDPEALAGALNCLLSDNRLRLQLGEAARHRVEQEFSADRMTSRTLEVYSEVLG